MAASLIRFIRGKGGSTQKRIEEELGVKIIFPSSRKEDFIIIEGSSAESLARAADKVQVILDEVWVVILLTVDNNYIPQSYFKRLFFFTFWICMLRLAI